MAHTESIGQTWGKKKRRELLLILTVHLHSSRFSKIMGAAALELDRIHTIHNSSIIKCDFFFSLSVYRLPMAHQ